VVVAVLSEDAGDPLAGDPMTVTFRRPGVDWGAVAEAVRLATVAAPGPLVQAAHARNEDFVAVPKGDQMPEPYGRSVKEVA
jgi:hypothetical protein